MSKKLFQYKCEQVRLNSMKEQEAYLWGQLQALRAEIHNYESEVTSGADVLEEALEKHGISNYYFVNERPRDTVRTITRTLVLKGDYVEACFDTETGVLLLDGQTVFKKTFSKVAATKIRYN